MKTETNNISAETKQETGESQETYLVLVNHEEQYSLWPSYKIIPKGWTQVFGESSKQECLNYVDEHWTDMRPLSLRKALLS